METIDEEIVQAPSLRDVLEDAYDKEEAKSSGESTPTPAEPAAEPGPAAAEPSQSAPPAEPATEAQPPAQVAAPEPTVPTELKAPAQWKPNVREKWNALPREVQEEVLRRESDSMRLIGSVGPKIKLAETVSQHLAPFAEQLSSAGIAPTAFLDDVFTSIKSLARGTPQERAEVVANIVQSYGVDLRTLDAVLTQRVSAPPEVLEARRMAARAEAVLKQNSQSIEHQSALEAERTLAAFAADPKHEFIADVRDLMADLIESNRVKTLDEAYTAAIWAHPDTRKVLLQREAQSRAESKNRRAVGARLASSSVRGAPVAPAAISGAPANRSLRDEIAAAFDEHTSL